MPDLGLYDDMDALLSPAEPRSDAAMTVAIRAEAALAADRKLPCLSLTQLLLALQHLAADCDGSARPRGSNGEQAI